MQRQLDYANTDQIIPVYTPASRKVITDGQINERSGSEILSGERAMAIARYTLAVDRRGRRGGNGDDSAQTADFIPCVAFDRAGEFAEKYFHQGTKLVVTGRIQTGSYTQS